MGFDAEHEAQFWSVIELYCPKTGSGWAPSERSQADAHRLARSIRESVDLGDRTCGNSWVWHDLRAAGEQCDATRAARLMKASNRQTRRECRGPMGQHSKAGNHIAPNYPQLEFEM